jgi:bacteriorhodopsin
MIISNNYIMKSWLTNTLYFSLFIQVISIAIGLFGLTLKLNPIDQILRSTVGLETLVSSIQFSFYVWYAYHFKEVAEVTFYRYHDWFITTPVMLFTTMLYYDYNNNPDEKKTIKSVWDEHRTKILLVFAFNAMMLVFGYLYEIKYLDLLTSNTMGFVGLIGSFYIIYDSFVAKNLPTNLPLFIFISIVWGLYGVAATLSPVWKNMFYNVIDTISKNFYGIFLTYTAYQKAII